MSHETVRDLEMLFKRIGNDLQFARHRLEGTLSGAAERNKAVPDIYKLSKRIKALQEAVPSMAKAFSAVDAEEKELGAALSARLLENFRTMKTLHQRVNSDADPEWDKMAAAVREE
ncbi:unnamed protein product [Chrysoparadoxa australica]